MKRRVDDEARKLNAIESQMWTSDPEFYRQFNRAWGLWRSESSAWTDPQPARSSLWLLPVGLIVSGVLLCVVLVQTR